MAQVKVFGYADKISVKPGQVIQFHVNADGTDTADAHLVRLIHGDTAMTPYSTGTWGSRCMVMAGGAVSTACKEIARRAVKVGAQYSYTQRFALPGVGGAPKTDDHIVMTQVRYYPF